MTSRIRTWLPLLTTVGAVGCASYDRLTNDEYSAALKNVPAGSVNEAVIRGNKVAEPPSPHGEQSVGAATTKQETYDDQTTWDCKIQKVSLQDNPEEFVTLDPLAGIYPGALLQGKSLSAAPEPIVAKRGPGTITLATVIGVSGVKSVDLPEVSLASAVTAQSKILEDLEASKHAIPANFSQKVEIFDSIEEFAIKAKISQSFAFAKFNASMSASTQTRKSRVMAKVTQTYFTVNYERKTLDLSSVFAADVKPSDLASQIGPGNPATYVSSVTYGRVAYLVIESASSKSDLALAVDATWGSGSASLNIEQRAAVNNATVSVIGLGGNITYLQKAASKASLNGSAKQDAILAAQKFSDPAQRDKAMGVAEALPSPVSAVKEFLEDDSATHFGIDNPPSPIAYTVRNLVDNTVVKNGLGTEYEKKSCIPVVKSERLQLALDAANLEFGSDAEGRTSHLDRPAVKSWPGSTGVQNSSNDVYGVVKTALNGHQAAGFVYPDSGARGLSCNFALAMSYTAVIVAQPDYQHAQNGTQVYGDKFVDEIPSRQATFITSRATDPYWVGAGDPLVPKLGEWFHVGSVWDGSIELGGGTEARRFLSTLQSNGQIIVTSHQEGSGNFAWSNGQQLQQNGTDSGDPRAKASVISGCAVGTFKDVNVRSRYNRLRGVGAFMGVVGEVRGYKGMLSTAERRVVECELSKKWSGSQPLVANCTDGKPNESY